MQEGYPIAYENRKLKDPKHYFSFYKREITAIIHCLRMWWHYLLGAQFVVKTDNITMNYF